LHILGSPSLIRGICLVGAIAGLAYSPIVLAGDPKPDASVKNKNLEASVLLDD
jgi:hypothetical protein